jgi:deoxyribose-phosphate aldolase
MNLANTIDHTLLKPDCTSEQIKTLCTEAIELAPKSVCIPPNYVSLASSLLKESPVLVCTVIGFPLGYQETSIKALETKLAVELGADEIDMVINISWLKSGQDQDVQNDIAEVVQNASGKTVKVILETCLLNDQEIVRACLLAKAAKAHFVKTSTGFSTGGATIDHVSLMKKTVGDAMEVKASGGIKTVQMAHDLIKAGATRLGTSSTKKLLGLAAD